MKTLFDRAAEVEMLKRLNELKPETQRKWGKMDSAQMLAHCASVLEMAIGERKPARRFIGRLLGPIFKKGYLNETPYPHGSPTDPSFVTVDPKDFAEEKKRLDLKIRAFSEGGEEKATRHPHPFFGPLTPREWGIGMYKHLDHHFRQFGI